MEVQTRSARTARASYGGGGSVRITKKIPRSRSEKKNCPVPSASMPMPIMVVANSSGCSSSEDDEDDRSMDESNSKPSSPSLVRLVGWDDKLCRPIYKVITSDSKKQKNNQTQPPVKDIAVVGNIEALIESATEDHTKPSKSSRPKKNSKKTRQHIQKRKAQNALETCESNVGACSFIEMFPSPAKTSGNISSNLDDVSLRGLVTKNRPSPHFERTVLNVASPLFKGRNRPKVVTTKRRHLYGSQRSKIASEEHSEHETDSKKALHNGGGDTSKQLFADSSGGFGADALPSLPDSAPMEIDPMDEHDSVGADQSIIHKEEETCVPPVTQNPTPVTNKMDDVHNKENEESYPCLSGDESVDAASGAKMPVDSEAAPKSNVLSPTQSKDTMFVTESMDTRKAEKYLPDSLKTPVRRLPCGPIATPNVFNTVETPSSIDQHLGKGTICSPPFLQNNISICDIPDSVTKTPRYDHEIGEERSVTLLVDTAHLDNRKIEPVAGTDQKDRAHYGGKGGVWVKKKRLRYSNFGPHIPLGSLSNGNIGPDIKPLLEVKRNHETEKVDAIQGTLVGWDDNLCRPIYEHLEEDSSKHGDLDHVHNMCDQDDENSEIHVDTNSPGYKEPQPDELTRGKHLNQALRAYGVRKRGRSGFSSAAVTALKEFSSPSARSDPITRRLNRDNSSTPTSTKKIESAATERSNELPAESPNSMYISQNIANMTSPDFHQNRKSICSLLDSGMKESPMINSTPTVSARGPKRSRRQLVLEKVNNKESLVETNAVCYQPSSNTSLVAARAFFEKLDTTQKLVFDKSNSKSPIGHACVRTTRDANMQCPQLQDEYANYCVATKESGVEPLELTEYVSHRSTHFRKLGMYDGLLDE